MFVKNELLHFLKNVNDSSQWKIDKNWPKLWKKQSNPSKLWVNNLADDGQMMHETCLFSSTIPAGTEGLKPEGVCETSCKRWRSRPPKQSCKLPQMCTRASRTRRQNWPESWMQAKCGWREWTGSWNTHTKTTENSGRPSWRGEAAAAADGSDAVCASTAAGNTVAQDLWEGEGKGENGKGQPRWEGRPPRGEGESTTRCHQKAAERQSTPGGAVVLSGVGDLQDAEWKSN